jgi:hypothetical protein
VLPAHAVFTRQEMYPFTLSEDLSSLMIPLAVMRHPIDEPSPWARRSA